MGLYKKTEKFVIEAFTSAERPTDVFHARRVAHWTRVLKPDASEALLVAAVAHDIERAIFGDWKKGSFEAGDLERHQNQSANEIEKFLRSENSNEKFIEEVINLVSHHEVGGNEDQNIICDADCLAYFEEKAMRHVKNCKASGSSKEAMRKKLDHGFERIHSEKAKQIAQKWYDEAVEELKK